MDFSPLFVLPDVPDWGYLLFQVFFWTAIYTSPSICFLFAVSCLVGSGFYPSFVADLIEVSFLPVFLDTLFDIQLSAVLLQGSGPCPQRRNRFFLWFQPSSFSLNGTISLLGDLLFVTVCPGQRCCVLVIHSLAMFYGLPLVLFFKGFLGCTLLILSSGCPDDSFFFWVF